MRNNLLAAAIFLVLFDHVSAHGPDLSAAGFVAAPEAAYLGSQMIGVEVYDKDHQDVARIDDIAVGKDGRVQAFVLSVGEYLGLVAHVIAVKPTALTIEPSNGGGPLQAHIAATADQLRAAPEYQYRGIRKACLSILGY